MSQTHHCPAILISAPSSGQGKTTFTAALARYHRNQGRQVRVFKTGPDFLDPMILEQASGHVVYQLDLWMVGEAACKQLLYQAAQEADLIIIEGVMGLFDGKPSAADLAECFAVPVAALIDARAMAQTFGAIAHGLRNYRPQLPFAGVIANRVASANHADMLKESLADDIPLLGVLPRNDEINLPDRHLGLVQADEIDDLQQRLDAAANIIEQSGLIDLPPAIPFNPCEMPQQEQTLKGVRIGIARDMAFAFIYPANLDLLRTLGAELVFFSPLTDQTLPDVDSIWLPGGYPELHLETLQSNTVMQQALADHHKAGKPILAECGGMLYLLESLTNKQGNKANMAGLLKGDAVMAEKLVSLGMQTAPLFEQEMTAHTFHHSRLETDMQAISHGIRKRGKQAGEEIYQDRNLIATYLHLYFPSNLVAVTQLFSPVTTL